MKPCLALIALSLILSGCATLEEAYYVDREFGQDSRQVFASQQLNPDHTSPPPAGLEGITTEQILEVYQQTFAEKQLRSKNLGLGSSKQQSR